jgi:uncharacterized membrane protein
MNEAHLHLLTNHLPIIGSILGGLVLFHGLWTKNNQTKIAAYYVIIISAIGAGVTYLTGEGAEEAVEHLQGISKKVIHEHEEFAEVSIIAIIISGVAALIGVYLAFKNSRHSRNIAWATLFISIISFGLMARTGYLGGLIRHGEINSTTVQEAGGENEDKD